jgi:D-tyrosyl-tRNA(Tyr) deacylase
VRALVQRVSEGGVFIPSNMYSEEIKKGMVILLGIKEGDTESDARQLAEKCSNLRIFEDENERMNLSIKDIRGEMLIISQFTLYADTSRGNRPSFTDAAKPDEAIPLYLKFIEAAKESVGSGKVKTGIFGAMMKVKIINEGPVTVMVESK